jgi:2-keto-3-deoxy-L-rhamnonate aldolase RhmA
MDIKRRLKEGKVCLGAWAQIPSPVAAEAMASCGFHWLAVDMEHAPIDVEAATLIFMAADRHGVAPFARLPKADPHLARRLLDSGAQGLIVPVVESAQDFAAFARHCLYPPAGRRGVGLARCNLWGDQFQSYLDDFSPVLVAQIETVKGTEAADAIAALPETDALFLGPYDLSADLGQPGDFSHPTFVAAADKVRRACVALGKAPGMHQVHPDQAGLRRMIGEGFRFVAYGTDILALRAALGRPINILEGS